MHTLSIFLFDWSFDGSLYKAKRRITQSFDIGDHLSIIRAKLARLYSDVETSVRSAASYAYRDQSISEKAELVPPVRVVNNYNVNTSVISNQVFYCASRRLGYSLKETVWQVSERNTESKVSLSENSYKAIFKVHIPIVISRLFNAGRQVKLAVAPLIVAAALAVVPQAKGQMTWQWFPTANTNNLIGQVEIVNTNSGAIYDSYTVFLSDLANQIYSNNPSLHTNYSSGADLIASNLFSYTIDPGSEVANGWSSAVQTNGNTRLTHGSGDIDSDYDGWHDSIFNFGNNNMQRGNLNVKKSFLDLDGNGWTTNDLTIANDTNTIVAGGVGSDSDLFFFTNYIPRITVVSPTLV